MSDFAVEDDAFFPAELVGRPTSEVLKYLADIFSKYAEETSGTIPAGGFLYAESWCRNWATDAEKVEDERRWKAR